MVQSCAPRAALVGDHRQLGPCLTPAAAQRPAGLATTLFDRALAGHGTGMAQPLLLDTQYRMHPAISAFPNAAFYGGALHNGREAAAGQLPWPLRSPLTFLDGDVDSGGPRGEQGCGVSKVNLGEARRAAQLVRCLLEGHARGGRGLQPEGVGEWGCSRPWMWYVRLPCLPFVLYRAWPSQHSVYRSLSCNLPTPHACLWFTAAVLTPYAAQATALRRELRSLGGSIGARVEVSTVDAFQGREADVILVSTVRANARRVQGFLDDPRRACVALTRAKHGCVVLGSGGTLGGQEAAVWGQWLQHLEGAVAGGAASRSCEAQL